MILADYALLKRGRLDLPALFDPRGRYRYVRGVNPAAVIAVALAAAAYHLVPDALVKAAWGVGVGVVVHLVLSRLQASLSPALVAPLRPPPAKIAIGGAQQGRSQTHPR